MITLDPIGRPVVVTGAAYGIGAALASEAGRRGASTVVLLDIDEEQAVATANRLRESGASAEGRRCDVSDPDDVEETAAAIVAEHGSPALVFANAGVMTGTTPLLDLEPSDARWILGVNVLGSLFTLQSFGRRMVDDGRPGWLIATGSEHSLGVPHPLAGAYTGSKHAILGICDVLRHELPEHVGVSVLCPGLTRSQLWNSRRHRPDELGGPEESDPAAAGLMEGAGMDATTVAERAFTGVAAGDFLIPTHYSAWDYARSRAAEVDSAFARLAEIDTTDYDVQRLVEQMLRGADLSADDV